MIAWLGAGLVLVVAVRWRSRARLARATRAQQRAEAQAADDAAAQARHKKWERYARQEQDRRDAAPVAPVDPKEVWEVTPNSIGQRQLQTQHESRRARAELPKARKEPPLVAAAREMQQRMDQLEAALAEEQARRERRRHRTRSTYDHEVDMFGTALAAGASYLASCDWSSSSTSGTDDTSGGGGSFGGGGATVSFDD